MAGTDAVLTRLREEILRGTYAPNQRLIEADLADRLGASRFVLRNCLIQLAAEGLVELQPNRGARVRETTAEEAVEITELRQSIEALVAGRAAERVTDAQVAELREIEALMVAAVDHAELLTYSDLNARLHALIRQIAAHQTASRLLEQLRGQMVRHQLRLALVPGRPSISLPEHREIIDAVCSRDPERARQAMATHVDSVLLTLRTWNEHPTHAPLPSWPPGVTVPLL